MIIAALMLAAGPALTPSQRYDLTCMEATAWAMSNASHDTETYADLQTANYFYWGRLDSQNESIDWFALTIAETKDHRLSDGEYRSNLVDCIGHLTAKMHR